MRIKSVTVVHKYTHTHTSTYCSLEKLPIMSSLFFIFSFVFFLDWQIEIRDRAYILFFFLSSFSILYYSFLPPSPFLSRIPFFLSSFPSFRPPSLSCSFFPSSLLISLYVLYFATISFLPYLLPTFSPINHPSFLPNVISGDAMCRSQEANSLLASLLY